MALEDSFATVISNDAAINAILTGGIYKSGTVGKDGITYESTPSAFDANGEIKPSALVRQRALVPDLEIEDQIAKQMSAAQVVEIWLYEEDGYVNIDAVLNLLFPLLHGYQFDYCFPADWANTINRQKDEGALAGASLARQDWSVITIVG